MSEALLGLGLSTQPGFGGGFLPPFPFPFPSPGPDRGAVFIYLFFPCVRVPTRLESRLRTRQASNSVRACVRACEAPKAAAGGGAAPSHVYRADNAQKGTVGGNGARLPPDGVRASFSRGSVTSDAHDAPVSSPLLTLFSAFNRLQRQ